MDETRSKTFSESVAQSAFHLRLRMLRIGCVKYLNARPLIYGWSGTVDFDHPAALCRKLEAGDLDVALVSSLEYLRRPIYRIVDGVSISAHGAVYSVIVAHNEDLSRAQEIEIDPGSETSVALLRCLLNQRGLQSRVCYGTRTWSLCAQRSCTPLNR